MASSNQHEKNIILQKLLHPKKINVFNEQLIYYKEYHYLSYQVNFKEKLLKFLKNKQPIFIFLALVDNLLSTTGHANSILITHNGNNIEIERYDPWGVVQILKYPQRKIDYHLKKWFSEIIKEKINYYSAKDYCPLFGAQVYSQDKTGFCVSFTLFYVYYRLLHPELNRNQVATYFKKENPKIILKNIKQFEKLFDKIKPKKNKKTKTKIIDLNETKSKEINEKEIKKDSWCSIQ